MTSNLLVLLLPLCYRTVRCGRTRCFCSAAAYCCGRFTKYFQNCPINTHSNKKSQRRRVLTLYLPGFALLSPGHGRFLSPLAGDPSERRRSGQVLRREGLFFCLFLLRSLLLLGCFSLLRRGAPNRRIPHDSSRCATFATSASTANGGATCSRVRPPVCPDELSRSLPCLPLPLCSPAGACLLHLTVYLLKAIHCSKSAPPLQPVSLTHTRIHAPVVSLQDVYLKKKKNGFGQRRDCCRFAVKFPRRRSAPSSVSTASEP